MNALTVQNPCNNCDWETGIIIDKKIMLDYYNNNYYYFTETIINYIYVCVTAYTPSPTKRQE